MYQRPASKSKPHSSGSLKGTLATDTELTLAADALGLPWRFESRSEQGEWSRRGYIHKTEHGEIVPPKIS